MSQTRLPCPLGARCPTGSKTHYSDSLVYQEHVKMSQNQGKQPGGGNGSNQPFNDFSNNTGDKKANKGYKDNPDPRMKSFTKSIYRHNKDIKDSEYNDDNIDIVYHTGKRIHYEHRPDGLYDKYEGTNPDNMRVTDTLTEEETMQDLQRISRGDRAGQVRGGASQKRGNRGPGAADNFVMNILRRFRFLPPIQ